MRILFVVPYPPNLVRVRPYNLVRHLTARGHEVTLLTLWTTEAERADVAMLAEQCHQVVAIPLPRWRSLANCVRALPTNVPLQARYCWHPALAQQMMAVAHGAEGGTQFDVVHVEHLRGALYGLHYQRHAPPHERLPVVWDSVDCITHLFRQAVAQNKNHVRRGIARLELGRTAHYEGQLASQFDCVLVTSEADRNALLELHEAAGNVARDAANISVLPNGVDLEYFQPGEAAARKAATLVISGKMSYHANVTMALHLLNEVMPLVWERRPKVELTIVGKEPPREILAAAQHPNVTVTGTVADIRPYLQQATIAVAPILYGVGIQNKVLEAMACATPVVATPQALAALEAVPNRDVLVAEQPHAIAGAILYLLGDAGRRQAIGAAGRQFVEHHHHWGRITAQLEDTYRTLIPHHLLRTGIVSAREWSLK